MNRTQQYLGGLLLVQIALILLVRSPFSSASAGYETRPLLPALDAATPSVVEIEGGEDETIRLVRQEGEWRIEELDGFPAVADKVDELVGKLQDLRVRRPVVSSGRHHDTFKVADDDHEARVRLWTGGEGDPDVDLLVGSSPNFRTSHVRLGGEDAVYEVRGLSSYDVTPKSSSWIERELIDVAEASVAGLTLTNASGSFELFKEDGIWKVRSDGGDGPTLDQGKVDDFVRSAATLRIDDAAGALDEAGQGFASPVATLVLRIGEATEDGAEGADELAELTVTVGGHVEDDDSRRYVTRGGFGFAGSIRESSVSKLMEQTLDELEAS